MHEGYLRRSRAGDVREVLGLAAMVEQPRARWCLNRVPPYNPAYAAAEAIWIMTGSDGANFIDFFNPGLKRFAGNHDHYPGAYGPRLRGFGRGGGKKRKIDQIRRAVAVLFSESNHDTRQIVLQIWDKGDLPQRNGTPRSSDVPCNVLSMLKVRNRYLEWTQILRSSDVYRGLPSDLCVFAVIQEVIAGCAGLQPGNLTAFLDSAHIYVPSTFLPERDEDLLRRHVMPNHESWPKMPFVHASELFDEAKKLLFAIRAVPYTKRVEGHLQEHGYLSFPDTLKVLVLLCICDTLRRLKLDETLYHDHLSYLDRSAAKAYESWQQYRKEKE